MLPPVALDVLLISEKLKKEFFKTVWTGFFFEVFTAL
jgi:hypothetical protein